MSAHHEESHSTGTKPVAFTVPFILACVTLIILLSFLSLCDPPRHRDGRHEDKAHNMSAGAQEDHAGSEDNHTQGGDHEHENHH